MLKFEYVINCKTTEELNKFIQEYLDQEELEGEQRRKTYWALFYTWKESNASSNETK